MSHTMPAALHDPAHFKKLLLTIFLSLAGWAMFVFADTQMKFLTAHYAVPQLIWTVNSIGLIIAGGWILFRHGPAGFLTKNWKLHFIRGLLIVGSSYFVVNALRTVPLADFYSIVFLSPIILAVLSHFFLGERLGIHRMAAILVGFSGVVLIAGPQFDDLSTGIILCVCAAVVSACNGVVTRKIGREKVIFLYALFPFLFNSVLYTPWNIMNFQMPDTNHLPLMFGIPPLILAGFVMYSIAMARTPEISIIAPMHYTQLLWGTLLGYLIFGHLPAETTVAGAAIIVGAGLYIVWREHLAHRRAMQNAKNLQTAQDISPL